MTCECCGKQPAKVKDFRTKNKMTEKYRVCIGCFKYNDLTFWRVMARNITHRRNHYGRGDTGKEQVE